MSGIKQIRKQSVVSNDHIFNDRWLVKQLETTMVAPGRSPTAGVFYPSSLGNPCDRYLYLAYNGLMPPLDVNPKLQRIFDTGGSFEERVEGYLTKADLLQGREIPAKFSDPPISGRIDFIIKGDKDEKTILELKTINSDGFSKLKVPKPEHVTQVQLYLNIAADDVSADSAFILYENKNTQDLKSFKILRDPLAWAEVVRRCQTIMGMKQAPIKCTGLWYCDCKKVIL
tara:strand:+ start:104 stop:787 length:684 start_codon:yes stop_codon:yes gene_type:complete